MEFPERFQEAPPRDMFASISSPSPDQSLIFPSESGTPMIADSVPWILFSLSSGGLSHAYSRMDWPESGHGLKRLGVLLPGHYPGVSTGYTE